MAKVDIAVTLSLIPDYERTVFSGVKQRAKDRGDTELFMWSTMHKHGISPRGKSNLSCFNIKGILSFVSSMSSLRRLQSAGIPVVDVSGLWEEAEVPSVHVDNAATGRMAAQHLLDNGIKSFAFWGNTMQRPSCQRRDAFVAELKKRGCGCSVFGGQMFAFPLSERELQAFRRWIGPLPKPVGVMCSYDYPAAAAAQACRQAGYSIPEQVALIGVGNDESNLILSPIPLTSIDVNPFMIGYKAMDLLYRIIRTGRIPSRHILLPPGALIARQSTDILAIDNLDLVKAMRFIKNNADKPVTVRDLLEAVPVSRRNLEMQFKKVLGRTPRQQIQHVHIERAKILCEDFNLSLGETAELSGFTDQATFCRIFKRFEKCTPIQYRKQVRQAKAKDTAKAQ